MPETPSAASIPPHGSGAEESLIHLATEIAGYNTIAELLDHLPGHLRPLFAFDGVGIVLHNPATNEVTLSLSFGAPEGIAEAVSNPRPVHFGPAGWVFQSQQPRFDTLTAENTHPTLALLYKTGFRSALWLPLSTSRTQIGVFVVVRKTADPIPPEYHRLIQWAANIV